jgi:hypothetical protein
MSEAKIEEICETCDFWGQSSGEFGVCVGPEPADRAARTDTCKDWKLKRSLAGGSETVPVSESVTVE